MGWKICRDQASYLSCLANRFNFQMAQGDSKELLSRRKSLSIQFSPDNFKVVFDSLCGQYLAIQKRSILPGFLERNMKKK
jgi:hypothetical protein